jgi:hypothetical protein
MGFKIMTKSKNRPTKWQFFHENHQLGKVVEMKGIDSSFVLVGFSRTGTERLKNWIGKCEGLGGGDRRVKEPEWEMGRIDRGDRRVKEPEWEMRRTGQGGSTG